MKLKLLLAFSLLIAFTAGAQKLPSKKKDPKTTPAY